MTLDSIIFTVGAVIISLCLIAGILGFFDND